MVLLRRERPDSKVLLAKEKNIWRNVFHVKASDEARPLDHVPTYKNCLLSLLSLPFEDALI